MMRLSLNVVCMAISFFFTLYLTCSLQNAGNSQDVSSGGKKICGTLYDSDGNPAADARVVLRPRDFLIDVESLAKRAGIGTAFICSTTTDRKGRFSFTDDDSIPPGTYAIEATAHDGMSALFIDSLPLDSMLLSSCAWLGIDTPEYPTTLVPVGGVRGEVRLSGVGTLTGTVTIFGLARSADIGADGSYAFTSLPQGRLRLYITLRSGTSVCSGTVGVETVAANDVAAPEIIVIPVDNRTGGTGSFDTCLLIPSTTAIVAPSAPAAANSGYLFTGWNTAADGSGTTYRAGDTIPSSGVGDGLFALWEPACNSAGTSVVSTVYWTSQSFVNDRDAIYYPSVSDPSDTARPSSSLLVRADKKNGEIVMRALEGLWSIFYLCGEGEWLYFTTWSDHALYRFPKSFDGTAERIAQLPCDYRLLGVLNHQIIMIDYSDTKGYNRPVCRYDLSDGSTDTLKSAYWFSFDDTAYYWSVRDSAFESKLFRQAFGSDDTVELYSGEFTHAGIDDRYIYISEMSIHTNDSIGTHYSDCPLIRIDKSGATGPMLVLEPNEHFRPDDAFIVVDDNVYVANLSGELWKIPIADPVGGAQLVDKWGSYDDDDFREQLFGDSDALYWIAGPDPAVRISDDDAGVLLRTKLSK